MKPLFFAMPGSENFCTRLAEHVSTEVGKLDYRRFPDGESYLRFEATVDSRPVVLVDTLNAPDEKTLRLYFAAKAARELGAIGVGLVSPYLAYMRQDKRFKPGEAITSNSYAALLSSLVDWIVTVDPHLHRRTSMSEIYSVPVAVCHAAPLLSDWIAARVPRPLVIGPDLESEQWVAAAAGAAHAPYSILAKTRLGDREIRIEIPDLERWREHTPVLIDDIISSGRTMEVAVRELFARGFSPPICLGVHGLFAGDAYERLIAAGAARVASTNTIVHRSNEIDVSGVVAMALSPFLR